METETGSHTFSFKQEWVVKGHCPRVFSKMAAVCFQHKNNYVEGLHKTKLCQLFTS